MPQASQDFTELHTAVAEYYGQKVRRHGATPAGADWLSAAGQDLRLALLLRVCDLTRPFSLNDLGCGYGALLNYLQSRHPGLQMDYLGIDASPDMVSCAAYRLQRHPAPQSMKAHFIQGSAAPRVADYAVASGIFNVVPPAGRSLWPSLIAHTLSGLHSCSQYGFAVNFLGVAPEQPDEPRLYRTPPEPWIAYCEDELGTKVTLIDGYALNEFTILASHDRLSGPAALG